MTEIDVAKIAQEAQAALDNRVAAATTLATAQQLVTERQAAVAEAEAEHGDAYAQALEHGWTAAELKGLGLAVPARKATARAKKAARVETVVSVPDEDVELDTPSDEVSDVTA